MKVKLFILLILCSALSAGAVPKEFLKLIPAVDNRQYNKWTDSKLFRQGYEALSYESLAAKMAREIDVIDADITVALDSTIKILEQELKQHPRNGYAACNLAIAKLLIRGSMSPEGEWPDYYHDDDELEPEELAQIEQQRAANKALCEEIVTLFNRSLKLIPAADNQSHCVAYRGIAFALLIQQADNSLIENAIEKAIALHPCKAAYITRIFLDTAEQEIHVDNKKQVFEKLSNHINEFYDRYPNDLESIVFKILMLREKEDAQGLVDLSEKFLELTKTADKNSVVFDIDAQLVSFMKEMRANGLKNLGRYSEAIDMYLDMMEKDNPDCLYGCANENDIYEIANEDPDMVMMKIKQHQSLNEESKDKWNLMLGNFSQRYLKDYRGALEYFEPVLKNYPRDENVIESIAQCHYMLGDIDKALIYAEAAEIVNPDRMTTTYENMLLAQGRVDELIKKYETRLSLGDLIETEEVDYFKLGYFNMLKRDWPRAVSYLEKYKEELGINHMTTFPLLYYLGISLKEMGKTAEARECFDKALQDDDDALSMLATEDVVALLLNEVGRQQEAREILKTVIVDSDSIIDMFAMRKYKRLDNYDIACCYASLGDIDKTLEYLKRHFDKDICNFGLIDIDWHFDKMRNLPEFKTFIAREKEEISKIQHP